MEISPVLDAIKWYFANSLRCGVSWSETGPEENLYRHFTGVCGQDPAQAEEIWVGLPGRPEKQLPEPTVTAMQA